MYLRNAGLTADVPEERVRIDGRPHLAHLVGARPRGPVGRAVGVPLEVVVGRGALRIARVPDVADQLPRTDVAGERIRVRGQMGVVHVAGAAGYRDGQTPEAVRALRRAAGDGRVHLGPVGSEHVVPRVQVIAASVPRRPEVVAEDAPRDRARPESLV